MTSNAIQEALVVIIPDSCSFDVQTDYNTAKVTIFFPNGDPAVIGTKTVPGMDLIDFFTREVLETLKSRDKDTFNTEFTKEQSEAFSSVARAMAKNPQCFNTREELRTWLSKAFSNLDVEVEIRDQIPALGVVFFKNAEGLVVKSVDCVRSNRGFALRDEKTLDQVRLYDERESQTLSKDLKELIFAPREKDDE